MSSLGQYFGVCTRSTNEINLSRCSSVLQQQVCGWTTENKVTNVPQTKETVRAMVHCQAIKRFGATFYLPVSSQYDITFGCIIIHHQVISTPNTNLHGVVVIKKVMTSIYKREKYYNLVPTLDSLTSLGGSLQPVRTRSPSK